MQNQASVTLVFERVVDAVRSICVIKQVAPVLFVIVAWGGLLARPPSYSDGSLSLVSGLISPARFLPSMPSMPNLISQESQAGIEQVKPELVLTKEQKNLVSYLSSAYRVDSEEVGEYVSTAYAAAKALKVDPLLVLSIMSIESSFDPDAQSDAGAQGLMQVLTRVHAEKFLPFGGVKAAFDVRANILVGTQIIQEYIRREGTVESALKSYVGAALMQDDGGYGWKVLGQRTRLLAVAQGKPIPKIPDQKPNDQHLANQKSSDEYSGQTGGLMRQERFFALEESAKLMRVSYSAQPPSLTGAINANGSSNTASALGSNAHNSSPVGSGSGLGSGSSSGSSSSAISISPAPQSSQPTGAIAATE